MKVENKILEVGTRLLFTGEGACTAPGIWYRILIALLPPWFRFAQSVRRYFTTSDWFPHLVNAGKYFSSILVIVLASVAGIIHSKFFGF